MKGKLVSVVTMFIIGALLMSTLGFIRPAFAATRIYLDPSVNNYTSTSGPVGATFDVTVWIEDIPQQGGNSTNNGAGAFNIYLEFNDDNLMITQWVEPTTDPEYIFYGKTTSALPTPPDPGYVHISAGKGSVKVAGSLFPTPPKQNGTAGSGPFELCIFTFRIDKAPAKLDSLTSALKINTEDSFLIDVDGNDITPITKEDGSYTNTWVTPANVNLDMNPATVTLDEWNWHIGETFNVQFRLTSLASTWELTAASFDVRFDEYVVDVVGGLADVTFDPIWGTTSATFDYSVLNNAKMSISVSNPSSNPSGTVITATVKFTVMHQNDFMITPVDLTTTLTYESVLLYDHVGSVNVGTLGTCVVTVKAKKPANLPWMEVVPPSVVLGPDPSIGEEFDIGIKLTGPPPEGVPGMSHIVGAQFRLFFDDTIITPVGIDEGSFFQDPTWNLYGTFFYGTYETDGLGPHVLVGTLLLPNGSSGLWDQTTFPNGEGMIATIRFKALVQECPNSFECDLTLGSVFGEWLINKDGEYVMMNETAIVNGHYEMLPFDTPGRVIDIYGGAVNDGYGVLVGSPYLQFPVPYGGQGPNHWMDIVFPQSQIYLNAYVTYNYWPVQSKDVGWEIEGPYTKLPNGTLVKGQRWQIWDKETSTTDANGIATLTFRMPWPCEDPDGITGIWKITGTGIVGDVQINDVIIFYYERLVYITSVTTDKYYYIHTEYVKVTVNYETHAVQTYPALFAIVIKDDLFVPFGMALYATTVGGATFCTWKTDEFEVEIFIPKWAYAGYGHVHVNCYDKDPTDGGFAWIQEYTPLPEIQIGPY